ncbi:MAG: hypothetical protein FWC94_03245 [Bacteroidales bacterium]|nr:hypothetical protein [Bacteroidales bacterium]
MKRNALIIIIAVFTVITTACGNRTSTQDQNILIAYFSLTGNTKTAAEHIQAVVGGELFTIQTVLEYSEDFQEVVERARYELANDVRPELVYSLENFDNFDIIFLGYPIWANTVPMAIRTFIETYDLSGKTVVLFSTSGRGDNIQSVEDLRGWLPDANIIDAFNVNRENIGNSQYLFTEWAANLEL